MENTRSISFSGKIIETTVTDKGSVADAWKIIVGLDSEWRPNTNPDLDNTTAVLQLCVDTKCLILQMLYVDNIPESLKNFLSDPIVTFLSLRNEYGLHCSSIADVRELSMRRYPMAIYRKPGLKDVARLVVGLDMPKPKHVCRSDWQSRALDDMQIEYACIDAYASFKIDHKLPKEM
ncbi:hypothetical protein ACOSQ4_000572 [Xanthoceras sorbifolium]